MSTIRRIVTAHHDDFLRAPEMHSSAADQTPANPRHVIQSPTPVTSVRFADGRVYLVLED